MFNDIQVVWVKRRWLVRTFGTNGYVYGSYRLRRDAVIAGTALAKYLTKTELFVMKRNGQIGYRNSYGNDPTESRG